MKLLKKLTLATLLLVACFIFANETHAQNEDLITSPYITIYNPSYKHVYYKGERIYYNVVVQNPWSSYWCRPFTALIKDGATSISKGKAYGYMVPGEKWRLKSSFKTSSLSGGKYYFATLAMPIVQGTTQESKYESQKYAGRAIYVRTLKAPKGVKAVGKKKAVRITYKKVTGATKYYIYRSVKKTSGYKLIYKTKNTTFTNKGLKKGNRYYYKVKSVRTVNNKVLSKYSKRVTARAK